MGLVEVTNVITGAKCKKGVKYNKGHNTVMREDWVIRVT